MLIFKRYKVLPALICKYNVITTKIPYEKIILKFIGKIENESIVKKKVKEWGENTCIITQQNILQIYNN